MSEKGSFCSVSSQKSEKVYKPETHSETKDNLPESSERKSN